MPRMLAGFLSYLIKILLKLSEEKGNNFNTKIREIMKQDNLKTFEKMLK